MFQGALRAAEEHELAHEVLDAFKVEERYPAYRGLPPDTRVVYQPDGGFLLAERTILAHVNVALRYGADLRFRQRVLGWRANEDGVEVETESGKEVADRLVICAGAWARAVVPSLAELAVPERQVLAWL